MRLLPYAEPARVLAALPRELDAVVVADGRHRVVAVSPDEVLTVSGPSAFAALDDLAPGWWAGFVSYDLGRWVERVDCRSVDDVGVPDLALARFGARLVLEAPSRRHEHGAAWVEGDGATATMLEEAVASPPASPAQPGLGPWTSGVSEADFESAVASALELIASGECYQVNLTRRLTCEHRADPVALWGALERHNPAPHAAFVRFGDFAVVSASPELFLRCESGRVETRPIKGTGLSPTALAASAKDRAENVMIVDLARNDLGRVCRYGSIEVPELFGVEAHPGLFHLVSTVRGVLEPGITLSALLRATFPPASVTGAPKPRVMQAIEDLERVRRGVYCGGIGFVDTARSRLELNVAIRTFTVAGDRTFLGVGGGVVADSQPAGEWAETELKAARLLDAASAGALVGASAR